MSRTALRAVRHAGLGAASAVAVAGIFWALPTDDPVWKTSMGTAYVGLAWVVLSLLVGPWNVIRRKPNPVSTNLRRDVGIWAGIVGLIHVGVGLFVHVRGRPWLYFIWENPAAHLLPTRYDVAGLANWSGLAATLILAGLLALSNDISLRRFGTRRWKWLQRWNYGLAGLMVVHGATYQFMEKRTVSLIIVFAASLVLALAVQIAGVMAVRRKQSAPG